MLAIAGGMLAIAGGMLAIAGGMLAIAWGMLAIASNCWGNASNCWKTPKQLSLHYHGGDSDHLGGFGGGTTSMSRDPFNEVRPGAEGVRRYQATPDGIGQPYQPQPGPAEPSPVSVPYLMICIQ